MSEGSSELRADEADKGGKLETQRFIEGKLRYQWEPSPSLQSFMGSNAT